MKMLFSAVAIMLSFAAASSAVNETETWNMGVDSYRRGDITNALNLLKPLMLSEKYSARAAEIVAKIEYDSGRYEESAAAAQIALRTSPSDKRLNRNFSRAVAPIASLRAEKRLEQSKKLLEGKDLGALLRDATMKSRVLMDESPGLFTNAAEKAVSLSSRLSGQAEALSLICPYLNFYVRQAVTNEESALVLSRQIEKLEEDARVSAVRLSDIDENAYQSVAETERGFYGFFKLFALPPLAIDEDLICQSNAYMGVESINARSWQSEALEMTRVFREKFPAWAKAYEQQAQADTNKPPFTAEAQGEIAALSHELEKLQLECCKAELPPEMKKSLTIINRIKELLPKDGSSGGGQSKNPPNDDNKKENSGKNDSQDQNDASKDENRIPEQNSRQDENGQNREENEEPRDEKKDKEDYEIESVLKKARERNNEYEAEKKARMRKAVLPPNEKDW